MNFKFPLHIAVAAVVLTGVSIAPIAASECSSVVSIADCAEFGRLGPRQSEGSEQNEADRRAKNSASEEQSVVSEEHGNRERARRGGNGGGGEGRGNGGGGEGRGNGGGGEGRVNVLERN